MQMPKMVVYEVWEVEAASPEAAKAAVEKRSKKDSVVVAAAYLDQLPHPVHLQEAQDLFFSSPAPEEVEDDDSSDG
jgi:hypothetical protein